MTCLTESTAPGATIWSMRSSGPPPIIHMLLVDRFANGWRLAPNPLVSVLDARSAVGECKSPLLQALVEFGRDAGIAELLCRLPGPPATDIPVGVERSGSVPAASGKYSAIGDCRFLSSHPESRATNCPPKKVSGRMDSQFHPL